LVIEAFVLRMLEVAEKTGVVEMFTPGQATTLLYRKNSPELFWVGVATYAIAAITCLCGFVYQSRNALRKLKVSE